MPPAPYRLLTLGRLALVAPDGREDASLGTRRRKLALLAVLAVGGRPATRDALVELFWGDQSEERARHSLSDALSHLRRALGPTAISARRAEVALAADAPLTVDALALLAAADAGRWDEVLATYGGPFLDAVHVDGSPRWEQWVDRQRARIESAFLTACRAECARLAESAAWEECALVAARWLECAPLSGPAARQQLAALAAPATPEAWRRALDAHERRVRLLAAEYGAGPDAETAAAAAAIAARLADSATDRAAPPMPAAPMPVAPMPVAPAVVRGRPRPAARPPRALPSRRRWWVAGGVAVALGVVATAAALVSGPGGTSRQDAGRRAAAAARLASAESELERGDRDRAIALLEEALRLDTTLAPAYHRLGLVLNADPVVRGRTTALLTQAVRHADPRRPQERFLMLGSYHLLVTADYARAASAYRELLALRPDDGTAWHNLGKVYGYVGDRRRAADAYARAVAVDPRNVASWVNLCDSRWAAGDSAGAWQAVEAMGRALPGHPAVFRETALLAAASGDHERAEQELRALLASTPTNPRMQAIAHNLLAAVYWSTGRIDEGDAERREAAAIDRRRGAPAVALRRELGLAAAAAWLRGDTAETRRRAGAALARQPFDALSPLDRPYLDLATTLALAGESERARHVLAEYERTVPEPLQRQDASALGLARATIALAERRFAEAIPALRRVPGPLCATCGLPELALAYERTGQPDSARAVYARYLRTPTLWRLEESDGFHRQRALARLVAQGRGD